MNSNEKQTKKFGVIIIGALIVIFLCVRGSSFDITGKWKSVGSDGFGQAQPGNIVTFDGSKCNFFSPYDTYAFYKDGKNYTLDTTSMLGQTVSFKVEVIDKNHIKLYYGSTVTELKRVS